MYFEGSKGLGALGFLRVVVDELVRRTEASEFHVLLELVYAEAWARSRASRSVIRAISLFVCQVE